MYTKYYNKLSNGIEIIAMFATWPHGAKLLIMFTKVDIIFFQHGPEERLTNN